MKWYVGYAHNDQRQAFRSATTPTQATHGDRYFAAIGPFRTKRAALYCESYHGPNYQHVSEFETAARRQAQERG